jgi:Phosphodiester glycosidase
MNHKIILALLFGAILSASEICELEIIKLPKDEFKCELILNKNLNPSINARSLAKTNSIITTGSYYNKDLMLDGLVISNGEIFNSIINKKLSGFFQFKEGVGIVDKIENIKNNEGVIFQSGPLLIEGDRLEGIRIEDGKTANRLAIGCDDIGTTYICFGKGISLYQLMKSALTKENGIKRLINLDGGAMAGVWDTREGGIKRNNKSPSIFYLRFTKAD